MNDNLLHSFSYNDVHIAPKNQIDLHQQSTWELSYVSLGSGMRAIGDKTEMFNSGDVVLIPPEIPHCWSFNDSETDINGHITNITVTFDDIFLNKCASTFPEISAVIMKIRENVDAVKFDKRKADVIISILNGMKKENNAEKLASLIRLLSVLSDDKDIYIVGHNNKMDAREYQLNLIKTYVLCNFYRSITIDDVARNVNMNRTSFCRFFKHNIGMSFVNYLNEYRISKACELLKKSDLNISQVCYKTGFNDIPYFCRVFRRIKCMTPSKYRITNY
jgi:AraC-type DNA-binding domain-containing proteins